MTGDPGNPRIGAGFVRLSGPFDGTICAPFSQPRTSADCCILDSGLIRGGEGG
jgi:hypothetical protein